MDRILSDFAVELHSEWGIHGLPGEGITGLLMAGALAPDLSRPGFGLEFKRADAARFAAWLTYE